MNPSDGLKGWMRTDYQVFTIAEPDMKQPVELFLIEIFGIVIGYGRSGSCRSDTRHGLPAALERSKTRQGALLSIQGDLFSRIAMSG
ncbi:MAG: hypothetical protein AB9834_07370 [Lentimicrobium sp.]